MCGSLRGSDLERGEGARVRHKDAHTRSSEDGQVPRTRGPATVPREAWSTTLPAASCRWGGGAPRLGPHPRLRLSSTPHDTGACETGHACHCSSSHGQASSLVSRQVMSQAAETRRGVASTAAADPAPSISGLTMLNVSWSRSSSSSSPMGMGSLPAVMWTGPWERLDLLEDLASPPLGFSEKSYKESLSFVCSCLAIWTSLLCHSTTSGYTREPQFLQLMKPNIFN